MKVWQDKKKQGVQMRKLVGWPLCFISFISIFSSSHAVDFAIICGLDLCYLWHYRKCLTPRWMRDD